MSCGADRELTRLMIKAVIDQLVADGTIQGGLLACDGTKLEAKQKIKDCATADAADAALATKIDTVQTEVDAALKVVVAELETKIAAIKDTFPTQAVLSADYELQITLNDGTSVGVSLAALAPTPYVDSVELINGDTLRVNRSDAEQLDVVLPRPNTLAVKDNTLTLGFNTGDKLEADLCGWRGTQPCEYYATLQIRMAQGSPDSCAETFSRVAYGFHPDDLRDPAADVQILDCNDNLLGYIYSTKGGTHTVEYAAERKDGTFVTLGYALAAPFVRVWSDDCCKDLFGDTP